MKVSVVTPSFNQGKFINRTLESVATQTGAEIVHVVFDGGSTDDTVDLLKRFGQGVKWVSEKDKGQADAVNKGIRGTIIGDKRSDFFFFHNGITALCNKMQLDGDTLTLRGLTVVNGCQSLNTILSCSETVKKLDNAFILFRFYEIPQRDRADKISIFTNSQSAVKARDLRSNDKRVLAIKKAFELKYPSGFFITKRGQNAPPEKNKDQVVDLSNFAKNLIAWHSQRRTFRMVRQRFSTNISRCFSRIKIIRQKASSR